jgi:hypothetical protein
MIRIFRIHTLSDFFPIHLSSKKERKFGFYQETYRKVNPDLIKNRNAG